MGQKMRGLGDRSPRLLWVDLGISRETPCADEYIPVTHAVEIIRDTRGIDAAIRRHQPDLICFDCDLPDEDRLTSLRDIRRRYPAIPFIFLTADRTAELAIWAFRLGAWDFFIKPVSVDELAASIGEFSRSGRRERVPSRRRQPMVPCLSPLPEQEHPQRELAGRSLIAPALGYLEQHFQEKIVLDDVAAFCGVSKSHFCRIFKKEHGVTFQFFVARYRIDRAVDLLCTTDLQVTQVAMEVGFAELSSFTRSFQRIIGILPSLYRKTFDTTADGDTKTANTIASLPCRNPNPVLSANLDGSIDFVNPAVLSLLRKLGTGHIEDLLPRNHMDLLHGCLGNNEVLTSERRVEGRTFVWSYHSREDGNGAHIYGNDVSAYLGRESDKAGLPDANPNPVLLARGDGTLRFVNPAAARIVKDLGVESVEDIMPRNHAWIVKFCLTRGGVLTEERRIDGHTLIWLYRANPDNKLVYIYGQDVSGYIPQGSRVADLSSYNLEPVFSSLPDGTIRYANPAATRLLKEFKKVNTAVDILPKSHAGLVRACLETGHILTKIRQTEGRVFAWSYQKVIGTGDVYIYGRELSTCR